MKFLKFTANIGSMSCLRAGALLIAFFLSISAFAADFQLYKENGRAVRDFDKQVEAMMNQFEENPGSTLTLGFGDNVELEVSFLGVGGQNIILDLGDGTVARIRLRKYRPFSLMNIFSPSAGAIMVDNLGDYKTAHKILSENNVPVPKLYLERSLVDQFLVIEKIDFEFDYFEYLEQAKKGNINKAADEALLRFAALTAKFHDIGDFRGPQLVFNKKRGWILLDFSRGYNFAASSDDGNIFLMDKKDQIINLSNMQGMQMETVIAKPGLPKHLEAQVLETIQSARGCKALLQ